MAIKVRCMGLLSLQMVSSELSRKILFFSMRKTRISIVLPAAPRRVAYMMNGEPKRVVIRIKRQIPIYPHLAPAVGEIVVADRLNDPYSSRYFYVLQRAGKRVIIRPDECVEISPEEAWPELSVSGRWARLHREQSREAARRSYYRRKQKK